MTNSIAVDDHMQVLQQIMYSLRVCGLPSIARTYTLPGMSGRAKPYVVNEDSPLTRDQQLDAERLKRAFVSWQRVQEAMGKSSADFSQKTVSELLGITQGALSQYLNAHTPLNPSIVLRLSKVIGVRPDIISPSLYAKVKEQYESWGFDTVTTLRVQESLTGSGLRKTRAQKDRKTKRLQRG
jgi:predicted transcriptional regulator